jgi:periplasmic protein TonB
VSPVRPDPAPAAPAPQVAATTPAAVAAAAPAPSAPEADPLHRYRAELIALAGRYKRYPRLAIDNNWEGRVEVRLVIGADGAIAALEVASSAGYAALDDEALEMIRAAKARAEIPAALRGRTIVLRIPVVFDLREAG